MLSYVLKRLLQSVAVMLFVAFICFVLSNYVGDPVNNMVGQEATIADRAALRRSWDSTTRLCSSSGVLSAGRSRVISGSLIDSRDRSKSCSRKGFRQPSNWSLSRPY